MRASSPTLPPVLSSPFREIRRHEPLTIDELAGVLRGMPRSATFWVDTANGLCAVVGVAPTNVRHGPNGPEASTMGAYGLVLLAAGASAPQSTCSIAEDRYRAVLQTIARGRHDGSRGLAGTQVQAMVRKVLIEMGDDWTKQGIDVG